MAFGIAGLNVARCFSKKFHQLALVVSICFKVYFLRIGSLSGTVDPQDGPDIDEEKDPPTPRL
jgi:hypothetical protein